MLTDFQRRAAAAVTAAIRDTGGEIVFREVVGQLDYWLGEASCSGGAILVYLYGDYYSADFQVADFRVGEVHRVFELEDFESQDAMIRALCESLQVEIAQGPYPFFP